MQLRSGRNAQGRAGGVSAEGRSRSLQSCYSSCDTCRCMRVQVRGCTLAPAPSHTRRHARKHTHTETNTYIHTRAHIHTHTHRNKHTHLHTHTHILTALQASSLTSTCFQGGTDDASEECGLWQQQRALQGLYTALAIHHSKVQKPARTGSRTPK